jgi:hypothetical protein
VFEQNTPTLYNSAALGSGVMIPLKWARERIIIGEFIPESLDESIQRNQYLKVALFGLKKSFANSKNYAVSELNKIEAALDLDPEVFTRPEALQQRIIGVDDVLLQLRRGSVNTLKNADKVPLETRQQALRQVQEVDNARMILGVPPRAYTEKEAKELPVGTVYLWLGKQRALRKPDKKDQ